MKKINKPNLDSEDIFEKCVNSFRGSNLFSKSQLLLMKQYIKLSRDEYERCGNFSQLHIFNENNNLLSYGCISDFEKLYTSGLSNSRKKDIYPFYKKIKSGFDDLDNKCAFCGVGIIKELDHFLPKSKFKTLAVEPLNLLPICVDCNREKDNYSFLDDGVGLIHPYFDNICGVWLNIYFSIEKTEVIISDIKVENNDGIDVDLFKRIAKTISELNIIDLYKSYLTIDCRIIRDIIKYSCTHEEVLISIEYEIKKHKNVMHENHPRRRLYECALDYVFKPNDFYQIKSILE